MAKIIKFETPMMMASRLWRENKPELAESAGRMQAIIDNPDKSDRVKLEAKMVKAIFEENEEEINRIGGILERLNETGIDIIKGGKSACVK